MRIFIIAALLSLNCVHVTVRAQNNPLKLNTGTFVSAVTLDSTNLPIVGIYTYFKAIPDTPKIKAFMGIIDKGYNVMNNVKDTTYNYYGYIGIEKRGSITQLWPQPSYGYETWDSLSNTIDSKILTMPKESDWVLYSPWDDRTLMKNVLTYQLASQMGYWAPRTKYCEVLINNFIFWDYKGVYVMMEKIKRDKKRVDIAKLDIDDNAGDSLTGGYIIAVDKNIWQADSGFYSKKDPNLFITYKYPKAEEITIPQKNYIKSYVDSFETAMLSTNFAHPTAGFRKYMDPASFMDFFIIQELSKNIDSYRRSSYLYKDKASNGGKLHAGPHWDYNSAWSVSQCGFDSYAGWAYKTTCWINSSYPIPSWWGRMLQDTVYANDLNCRYKYLRTNVLDTTNMFKIIDSVKTYLAFAQPRQYAQWGFTDSYATHTDTLKYWIRNRLAWMDANMPGKCYSVSVNEKSWVEHSFKVYPNPSSGEVTLEFDAGTEKDMTMELYNALGDCVLRLDRTKFNRGNNSLKLDLSVYAQGIYYLKISSSDLVFSKKITKVN